MSLLLLLAPPVSASSSGELGGGGGGGAPTLAGSGIGRASSGLLTATTTSLGTASPGDLVFVQASFYVGGGISFTGLSDSAGGNTWNQIGSTALTYSNLLQTRWFYSVLTNGGSNFTVTETCDFTGNYATIAALRFNGATGWALDKTATNTPGGVYTTGTSGATATRSAANELLIGSVCVPNGTISFDPGTNLAWVEALDNPDTSVSQPFMLEYFLASSVGTEGAEWSTVGTLFVESTTNIATFTYAGAGGYPLDDLTLAATGINPDAVTEYQDSFETNPYPTRWAAESNAPTWDSSAEELDANDGGGDTLLVYDQSIGFNLIAQLTGKLISGAGNRVLGPAVRMSGNNGYAAWMSNTGLLFVSVFVAGTRTDIEATGVTTGAAAGDFVTIFLEATGVHLGDVALRAWVTVHGTTKPGDYQSWPTGAALWSFTHTGSDRRNSESVHTYAGIGGRATVSGDEQYDFWAAKVTDVTTISNGTAAITLGALTLAATAVTTTHATAGITLGALTTTATAKTTTHGTLGSTLGAMTVAGTAKAVSKGVLAATLGALSLTATAKATTHATLTTTLGAVTSAATAKTTTHGTSAITLGVLTSTATAKATTHGTSAITLGTLSLVATAINPAATPDLTDDFTTNPYAGRWTQVSNAGVWDSTNGELDVPNGFGDISIRYNTSVGFDQIAQLTFRRHSSSNRNPGPSVRMKTGSNPSGYGTQINADGDAEIMGWTSTGTRFYFTSGALWATGITNGQWGTLFIAATGGASGGNVLLRLWFTNHGTTKPTGYQPWPTGAANLTLTHTATNTQDDSTDRRFGNSTTDIYAGIAGRDGSTTADEQMDWWSAKGITPTQIDGSANITLGALTLVGTAKLAEKAILTQTLAALTATATAKLASKSAASITLGALTASGTAKTTSHGTAAITLSPLMIAAATGKVPAHATLSITLGALTVSATTSSSARGTAAITLGALTSTATGKTVPRGTLTKTLDAMTVTATAIGLVSTTGSLTKTLNVLTAAATGKATAKASAIVTLGALTTTATAVSPIKASLNVTLGTLTVMATTSSSTRGTGAITLGALTSLATGKIPSKGSQAITLGALSLAATARTTTHASLVKTLGAMTTTATATVPSHGTSAITLGAMTVVAAGLQRPHAYGALTITLSPLTAASAGTVGQRGTLAVTLNAMTIAATATSPIRATSAITLGALNLFASSSTQNRSVGTLAVTLAPLTSLGVGKIPSRATFSTTLGSLTCTATVRVSARGVLSTTLGAVSVSATGGVKNRSVGTLTVILSPLTGTGGGVAPHRGTLTVTLGSLTCTSTARTTAHGALDLTLGAVVLNGLAAGPGIHGTLAVTLDPVTLTAASYAVSFGSSATTLAPLTLAATGIVRDIPPFDIITIHDVTFTLPTVVEVVFTRPSCVEAVFARPTMTVVEFIAGGPTE